MSVLTLIIDEKSVKMVTISVPLRKPSCLLKTKIIDSNSLIKIRINYFIINYILL